MWLEGNWVPLALIIEPNAEIRWHTYCAGGCGVYRLVAVQDRESKLPAIVSRVCGGDPSGTLYVGQTNGLFRRLSDLIRTHHPDYIVQIYAAFPPVLNAMYPPASLAVTWEYAADAVAAKARETQLLQRYATEFGEKPPRNSIGGGV